MAALTKLGLLEQPHTSAGRVPSAKGYRYYLDHLLTDDQPLDRVTRARVDAVFASLDHEPEKLAQGAAKALAAISGCTAAVSTPCAEDLCIAHYEVVQVGRSAAAVLAVTTAGYVRTRVARVRTGLSRENAAALAALLNRNLTFVAPVDLSPRLLAELCSQISPELVPVISAAAAILQDSTQPHVYLGGEQYLLDWPQLDGKVGSILVTPSSTLNADLRTIAASYGEFTPLVLEGTVLLQTKDRNPVYLFDHSRALYPLSQRFGTPDSRQFIQGAEMILYKDLQETASTPQP